MPFLRKLSLQTIRFHFPMQYNVLFPRMKIFLSETIGEASVSSSSWFSISLLNFFSAETTVVKPCVFWK